MFENGWLGGCIPHTHPPRFAPACTDNNANQPIWLQYGVGSILSQLFWNNSAYCTCTVWTLHFKNKSSISKGGGSTPQTPFLGCATLFYLYVGVYVPHTPMHPKKATKQSIKSYSLRGNMTPHYFKLQILKLEDFYKFEIAKFIHKFTHNKLPCRFHHYFSYPSDLHTHSTWTPCVNIKYFSSSFLFC